MTGSKKFFITSAAINFPLVGWLSFSLLLRFSGIQLHDLDDPLAILAILLTFILDPILSVIGMRRRLFPPPRDHHWKLAMGMNVAASMSFVLSVLFMRYEAF